MTVSAVCAITGGVLGIAGLSSEADISKNMLSDNVTAMMPADTMQTSLLTMRPDALSAPRGSTTEGVEKGLRPAGQRLRRVPGHGGAVRRRPVRAQETATTNEMSRSVQQAAGGTRQIATSITGVSTAAESTTRVLGQARAAGDELSGMVADLRTSVARFTY